MHQTDTLTAAYSQHTCTSNLTAEKERCTPPSVCVCLPVVLIMLLGVAVEAAAKMLGVLPGVAAPLVVGVPTVFTARLPGGGFFTGTTTLLRAQRAEEGSYMRTGVAPGGRKVRMILRQLFSNFLSSRHSNIFVFFLVKFFLFTLHFGHISRLHQACYEKPKMSEKSNLKTDIILHVNKQTNKQYCLNKKR